jgi:hypothetical protein
MQKLYLVQPKKETHSQTRKFKRQTLAQWWELAARRLPSPIKKFIIELHFSWWRITKPKVLPTYKLYKYLN